MAEFIVTTLSDELDGGATIAAPGGDGLSLREAIGLSNAETGEDSIVFADGLEGVVRLNNDAGTLQINDSLSIFGDNRITISGDVLGDDSDETGVTDIAATDTEKLADNTQLFLLGANALFSGLTLTGGRSADFGGGAIDAIGNELTILGSTFAGNITYGEYGGGAIYSNGQLTISSSTFDRNIASDGSYDGGHGGGAIFSRTGNLNAINTTFVGNQALQGDTSNAPSGGAIFAEDGIYLNNVTMTGNLAEFQGGGLFVDGEDADVVITNSIVLGNRANVLVGGVGDEIDGFDPSSFAISNSITTGANGVDVFAETETVNGRIAGVLADNAGPVQTVALNTDQSNPTPSNPALNAGGANARLGDARGIDSFGQRDLGAYQTIKDQNLIVTSLDDDIDATDGVITLREAVLAANGRDGADTITFTAGGQGLIRLTEGEIEITDAVTIDGGGLVTITGDAGANDVTLEGGITDVAASLDEQDRLADNSRVFNITDENADTTLSGLTLTGGRTTADDEKGGAVQSIAESLTIQDSTISGNSTAGNSAKGGGFYAEGDVTLTGSTISNNSTAGDNAYGGGLALDIEDIEVTNSTITGNSTAGESAFGGGLYVDGEAIVTNSTISNNRTAGENSDGGGIQAFVATVTNSTISGNSTTGDRSEGGGISAFRATVANSTISGNSTAGNQSEGGGMFAFRAATVTNSIILGNKALLSDGDELFETSDTDGLITVTGNNIIGADSTAFDTSALITGDGTAINADPYKVFSVQVDNSGVRAGFLRDNGGDVQTIALRAGIDNPALDAATISGLDARGQARGVDLTGADNGGTSDLGAFELQIAESGSPRVDPIAISVPEDALSALRFTPVTAVSLTAPTFTIASGEDADKVSIDASTGVISFNEAVNFEAPTDADGDNTFEFFVSIQGESGSGGTHTTTITITDANDAPVAAPTTASGDEDTVISGALSASDEDDDTLSFTVVSGPSNGSVSLNTNGSFQFTPVADFNGTDSFTFQASDGALSDIATATITVNPVDEPVDPVDPVDPIDPINPVDPPVPTGPTAGDDTLIGTTQNDRIDALGGNDDVSGLAGDDLLFGRGGNDILRGAAGDDSLRGNGGDDTLRGNGGDDNIKGNGGEDLIRGNGGDDVIRAGGAADNVKGGGGADQLNGGGGADTLRGNGGDDTLKGNGGADVFQFRASDRNDTISDFRQGQDKIQIQNGANAFEGLDIQQDGRDVLISFGAGQVRVITDSAGAFDEGDFIF